MEKSDEIRVKVIMVEKMSFKIVHSVKKQVWDKFVINHSKGNIFQTSDMMEVFKRTKRYEPISLFAINEDDEILAMQLAVIIRETDGFLRMFSSRSIIFGGPLFLESKEETKALSLLIDGYDEIAKKKALYTQIRNLFDTSEISSRLRDYGYEHEGHLNILIDLDKPKEEIWQGLTKARRNGVNRARRRGVIVEEIDDNDYIATFYSLLQETYRNVKLPLADPSLFESVFDVLVPKNMAKFLLVKYEEKYIGAMLILTFSGIVYDWAAGASRDHLRLCPNDLLAWHAIEWGHENGYHIFDFGGAGKPYERYGIRDFKKQFGGKLVNYGRYEKIYSPIKMRIAKGGFDIWRKLHK